MTKNEKEALELLRDVEMRMIATYMFDGGKYVRADQMVQLREDVGKALQLLRKK